MHHSSLVKLALAGALALASSAPSFAQSIDEVRPMPGPARHAGVYHVATGSWTRSASSLAAMGPDIIYNNTAISGYFAGLSNFQGEDAFSLIDSGRVPTTQSGIVGDGPIVNDGYTVDGLEFSYCTSEPHFAVNILFRIYDTYSPCDLVLTDPQEPFHLAGSVLAPSLYGSATGAVNCWTVTLDLSGGGEFCLIGDGGPLTQGTESFGIEWRFLEVDASKTGPVIAGDPDHTRTVSGANAGGGGTYYAGETCAAGSTGLDSEDFFARDGVPGAGYLGCGFFGGYLNTNGCGGPSNTPYGSLHTVLFADTQVTPECGDPVGDAFCDPASTTSSGTPAQLSAVPTSIGAGFRLEAQGGPTDGGGFGYFIVSSGANGGIPLGQGDLCLDFPQGRYSPVAGASLNSLGVFDSNGDYENLAGTSTTGFGFDLPTQLPTPPGGSITAGSTWHFQLWFRDQNPGATVNFTNGLTLTF